MTNGTTPIIGLDEQLYSTLIQCFFIIIVGYIAGQLNLLTTSHSVGLSRYISTFALPAVIFKNLVEVQFQSVSWRFLTSVLIAKTTVFLITMIITMIAERPRNFASMAQYAIMTTQSNDFPLILPIIDAVYKQSHPDFGRYVYLIAPISLVILNPIGFFFIELQKRLDDQRKHRHRLWNQCQLISAVFRDISRNPIVIFTMLGVVFNLIFHQHLPHTIDYVLTPIAQSFSATALFYLGLTMVGKLSRLQTHLVIVVCLVSLMKLVIFPLILRQAVFFLMTPSNASLNLTVDYSNLGFLYGTAPTAPSVVFYVPDYNVGLQAIASTCLVVSTILSGPIILISAKMISLRTLDSKTKDAYEMLLSRTAFDVSILSLLCTIIVLIGFCLRRRLLRVSLIHKYTFIFVSVQMLLALWTVVTRSLTFASTIFIDIGDILIALTTRTWATSLGIILMILICHSTNQTRQYSWLYHIFGWIVPFCLSLAIYFGSSMFSRTEQTTIGAEKFGKVQIILSIILLAQCILINSICLLRIARRTYRLRHDANESRRSSNSETHEERRLINEEELESPISTPIQLGSFVNKVFSANVNFPVETHPIENDTQLFRHGILVTFLNIDAFVCLSALLWLLLAQNRDGIYYEIQFLDTVLLHGQGIISFLIFGLDTDFLVPITRTFLKLLTHCGWNFRRDREGVRPTSSETNEIQEFECKIRPDFIQHCSETQRQNETFETIFNGSDFCQWLVANGRVDNEFSAQNFLQTLLNNKKLICLNQNSSDETNEDFSTRWFAFSK